MYKLERDEEAFKHAMTTSDAGLKPEIETWIAAGQIIAGSFLGSADWDILFVYRIGTM
jgi:hypothetical protein